jgi:hypothetical protein
MSITKILDALNEGKATQNHIQSKTEDENSTFNHGYGEILSLETSAAVIMEPSM